MTYVTRLSSPTGTDPSGSRQLPRWNGALTRVTVPYGLTEGVGCGFAVRVQLTTSSVARGNVRVVLTSAAPGRARRTADVPCDAALDDSELRVARAALAQGRRQPARSLLARTGDDWDRRGHRITVLALDPYSAAWAGEWLGAEPGSADAAALVALAEVRRVLRGKDRPARARAACGRAAPSRPPTRRPGSACSCWSGRWGGRREVVRAFEEVRARHADHHHAHHLMVARLAERRATAGPDPLHEVYDFAHWAAERAPADSPLAVLPVVAHAERYRVLATAGFAPADPAGSAHWRGRPPGRRWGRPSTGGWNGSRTATRAAWST
ncbi:hypothetical protein GCM10020295_66610 [Streptomyces cinereospinus]